MRAAWVLSRLVSTVAGALDTWPQVQKTIGKCPLHKYRSDPQCTSIVFPSWDGMPAYALNRLFPFGCGKIDAFFWVSDILLNYVWHIHSYCYTRLNRLILQRTSICFWIYGISIFSVFCRAKMDLDIILYCLNLQHNFSCLYLLRISSFPLRKRKKRPRSFFSLGLPNSTLWNLVLLIKSAAELVKVRGKNISWKIQLQNNILYNFNYILPN